MKSKLYQLGKNPLKGLIIFFFFTQSQYLQAEEIGPYTLVKEAATSTFERITLEREEIKRDPERMRLIMEQELMPYIDHRFSALKVLGKNFTKVPPNKIQDYIGTFREYLITSYALVLNSYKGQEVIFEPIKKWDNKREVSVRAVIHGDDSPDIKLIFKLRRAKNKAEWKAYDIVAEGISLISSKRNEFEPIIRREGIQGVIKQMQAANNKQLVAAP